MTPNSTSVRLLLATIGVTGWFGLTANAQANLEPVNNLPNPYRTIRDWARPPNGAKWAAVTAVEPGPDGSIYVIHRCFQNSCAGRTEPPILRVR